MHHITTTQVQRASRDGTPTKEQYSPLDYRPGLRRPPRSATSPDSSSSSPGGLTPISSISSHGKSLEPRPRAPNCDQCCDHRRSCENNNTKNEMSKSRALQRWKQDIVSLAQTSSRTHYLGMYRTGGELGTDVVASSLSEVHSSSYLSGLSYEEAVSAAGPLSSSCMSSCAACSPLDRPTS